MLYINCLEEDVCVKVFRIEKYGNSLAERMFREERVFKCPEEIIAKSIGNTLIEDESKPIT